MEEALHTFFVAARTRAKIIAPLQPFGSSAQAQSDTTFLKVTEAITRHKVELPDEVREELAHLERLAAVGVFTSSVVHEIKNALVGVKTCVQLSPHPELAEIADREMRRVESLVNLLLQYASKAKRNFAPVRLNEMSRETLKAFQPALTAKKIALQASFDASEDTVPGDQAQLQQALLNLLLNALDATPAGGTIRLTSGNQSGAVRLQVRDSGQGIPAEDLERIFDPFYTTKARGSGLGLGITRRIIRDHGGTIAVASEAGRGATFTLTFPLPR